MNRESYLKLNHIKQQRSKVRWKVLERKVGKTKQIKTNLGTSIEPFLR